MNVATNPKRVIVCADDFGLTEGASNSIIQLAQRNAISATSCAVDGDFCASHADKLSQASATMSIGVHLNLTENPNAILNASLRTWLLRCFILRRVDKAQLQAEVLRQLERFESIFKRAPDFVDGHEHVHQFPLVRDALLAAIDKRYGSRIAVRSTVSKLNRGAKASIIEALGGKTMHRLLASRHLATNADFAGVYDFTGRVKFSTRIREWLQSLTEHGLIMCHPEAFSVVDGGESVRNAEHNFFASDEWQQIRAECDVSIIPFNAKFLN